MIPVTGPTPYRPYSPYSRRRRRLGALMTIVIMMLVLSSRVIWTLFWTSSASSSSSLRNDLAAIPPNLLHRQPPENEKVTADAGTVDVEEGTVNYSAAEESIKMMNESFNSSANDNDKQRQQQTPTKLLLVSDTSEDLFTPGISPFLPESSVSSSTIYNNNTTNEVVITFVSSGFLDTLSVWLKYYQQHHHESVSSAVHTTSDDNIMKGMASGGLRRTVHISRSYQRILCLFVVADGDDSTASLIEQVHQLIMGHHDDGDGFPYLGSVVLLASPTLLGDTNQQQLHPHQLLWQIRVSLLQRMISTFSQPSSDDVASSPSSVMVVDTFIISDVDALWLRDPSIIYRRRRRRHDTPDIIASGDSTPKHCPLLMIPGKFVPVVTACFGFLILHNTAPTRHLVTQQLLSAASISNRRGAGRLVWYDDQWDLNCVLSPMKASSHRLYSLKENVSETTTLWNANDDLVDDDEYEYARQDPVTDNILLTLRSTSEVLMTSDADHHTRATTTGNTADTRGDDRQQSLTIRILSSRWVIRGCGGLPDGFFDRSRNQTVTEMLALLKPHQRKRFQQYSHVLVAHCGTRGDHQGSTKMESFERLGLLA